MSTRKPETLVDKVYMEVMRDLQRIEGEDYEEYMENVRYEVAARLQELAKEDLFHSNVKYD